MARATDSSSLGIDYDGRFWLRIAPCEDLGGPNFAGSCREGNRTTRAKLQPKVSPRDQECFEFINSIVQLYDRRDVVGLLSKIQKPQIIPVEPSLSLIPR